jgi:hypothetical protein
VLIRGNYLVNPFTCNFLSLSNNNNNKYDNKHLEWLSIDIVCAWVSFNRLICIGFDKGNIIRKVNNKYG